MDSVNRKDVPRIISHDGEHYIIMRRDMLPNECNYAERTTNEFWTKIVKKQTVDRLIFYKDHPYMNVRELFEEHDDGDTWWAGYIEATIAANYANSIDVPKDQVFLQATTDGLTRAS